MQTELERRRGLQEACASRPAGVRAAGTKLASEEACVSADVDHRLLHRWAASQRRQQAARQALPSTWRKDPRTEAQAANAHWVELLVRAQERTERQRIAAASGTTCLPLDDH